MTLIKKFSAPLVAVALVAVMALSLVGQAGIAQAAVPTIVNVIIDEGNTAVGGDSATDDDSIVSDVTTNVAVQIVVDIDDGEAARAADTTNETIVTLTTTIGTWSNGTQTIQVQCATDLDAAKGVVIVDDNDLVADSGTIVGITEGAYNNAAEAGITLLEEDAVGTSEGCMGVAETLILPVSVAVGTYQVTATTSNGVSDVETLTVTAAVGGTPTGITSITTTHNSIGYTGAGYTPSANGTNYTVRVIDANGNGVNGRQVTFATDQGVLVPAGTVDTNADLALSELEVYAACVATTTYGQTVIQGTATIGTTSTATGRASVALCGTSAAAAKTATVTATVTGQTYTTNSKITVSAEPTGDSITVVSANGIITVTVMVGGVPAPDDTAVTFASVPADASALAQACVDLHDGKAETAVAVAGGTQAQVLVTLQDRTNGGTSGDCATGAGTDEVWGSKIANIGVAAPPPAPAPTPAPVTAGTFSGGTIAPQGVSIVSFTGTVAQLGTAGAAAKVISATVTVNGVMITYVVGAPDFVNAAFNAAFPTGLNATLMIVKTGT